MSEHICELTPIDSETWETTIGVEVVRCRDCVHGHMTIDGKNCKWCSIMATHDIDSIEYDRIEAPNGYEPEPYLDADFFCAWGKRKESE